MRRPSLRSVVLLMVAGAAVTVGAAVWLAETPAVTRLVTHYVPPTPPTGAAARISETERQALRELGRQVQGRLLWASNRGGNHDLYEADVTTGRVVRLTDHPHVDFFGRYSPDGSRIVFLRSRKTWVSFREADGWDLFVMNADGSAARRVAEQAVHPAWMPDGATVMFQRANTVVALSLVDGSERVVHRGELAPTLGRIGDPEPGPDGLLAISLRGVPTRQRGVGIVDLASHRYRRLGSSPSACQMVWTPTGGLVWIEAEGHGGTRVMQAQRPDGPASVLMDLPGRYSHEYFPRVTSDGRWLVWGAAAEGHEHDRADYEIFAWRIGTPWSTALRLTYSEANDQWADLWLER